MNWNEVRKRNAKQSACKVKREAHAASEKARIAAAGGPFTLAEVKAATVRTEPPAPGHLHDREVWVIRGKDWVSTVGGWGFLAFCSWRQEPDSRTYVPTTPDARKWWAKKFPPVNFDFYA